MVKIEKCEDVHGVMTWYQTEKGKEVGTRHSCLPVSEFESSDDEPLILERTTLVKYPETDGIQGVHVRTI